MATTTSLSKIHIFPTEASFISNSSSIGANDLALIPDIEPTEVLAQNGYIKLPSGLIIQWGAYGEAGSLETANYFPIAFPNACFGISASSCLLNHTQSKMFSWATNYIKGNAYLDRFVCGNGNDLTNNTLANERIFIIAIGY